MRSNIPSLEQVMGYRVNRKGQYEGVKQSLYDSATYAAAGQTSLTFFQSPVGSGTKTLADTNMKAAGLLPTPLKFLIESIEVIIYPAATGANAISVFGAGAASGAVNDIYAIAKTGWLSLDVGSKNYLTEAPIGRFPPKTRLDGFAGASDATTAAAGLQYRTAYAQMAGRPYPVNPPILLESNQNFSVTLNWPSVVATPSTQTAAVFIVLDGILYRESQ